MMASTVKNGNDIYEREIGFADIANQLNQLPHLLALDLWRRMAKTTPIKKRLFFVNSPTRKPAMSARRHLATSNSFEKLAKMNGLQWNATCHMSSNLDNNTLWMKCLLTVRTHRLSKSSIRRRIVVKDWIIEFSRSCCREIHWPL